jgi:DNA polymerase III delta subunit
MSRETVFNVVFGDEPFFLDLEYERARNTKHRRVLLLDGEKIKEEDLLYACQAQSYDGSPRLILIDNAEKIQGKAFKAWVEDHDIEDSSLTLLAVARVAKLPDLWAFVGSRGKVKHHPKLKIWGENNGVVSWVKSESKRMQLNFDPDQIEVFCSLVGLDLYRLSSELKKLKLAGPTKITKEVLFKFITPSAQVEVYQLTEAVLEKSLKRAMNYLSELYRTKGEEAHVPITFSLIKQVEKIFVARWMLGQNATPDEIATALDMNVWRCKTHFLPHVKKHSVPNLIKCMENLRSLDVNVKGSARSKRTLVELAVLSVVC